MGAVQNLYVVSIVAFVGWDISYSSHLQDYSNLLNQKTLVTKEATLDDCELSPITEEYVW